MHNKEFTIGSSSHNTYIISDSEVTKSHLIITAISKAEFLLRNISNNPKSVIINRQSVHLARINKSTLIKIGKIRFTLDDLFKNTFSQSGRKSKDKESKEYILEIGKRYLVGASDICDITLNSPKIAWHSLTIERDKARWYILSKTDGKKYTIHFGGSLRLSNYQLWFNNNGQLIISFSNNGFLIAKNIEVLNPEIKNRRFLKYIWFLKKMFNKKDHIKNDRLIQSLSLKVKTGEFVGIIGPSGAGKSTLLKALRSIMPIENSGDITILGENIRTHPEILKEIGFIPQDDVVILELSVEENLKYAAFLRLPSDWPNDARLERVETILTDMQLLEQRSMSCLKISGGQRKRLNLALELMLESTFLLADEACSGLSALDTDNILQHLRKIADKGKGVILTIHSPDIEALDLMDTLIVLDVGGVIAYYGPAEEAVHYFDASLQSSHTSPKKIFDILEKKAPNSNKRRISPAEWGERYKSSLYQNYVDDTA